MNKNSHILRLREYESATIGSEWDATRKIVPPYVVAELERLQAERRAEYLTISRRRIKAQNYVGVIGVGDRTIEILPKTDEADDAARRRLVQMMSLTGMLPTLEGGIADLAPSVPCLLDAFMQAYARQLALEWRRGRISSYKKTDENRTYLRGNSCSTSKSDATDCGRSCSLLAQTSSLPMCRHRDCSRPDWMFAADMAPSMQLGAARPCF